MLILNDVQKRRKLKGITQKELSNELSISLATIIKVEKLNYCPKYQIRKKLCDYFGVRMGQLFYREDNGNGMQQRKIIESNI